MAFDFGRAVFLDKSGESLDMKRWIALILLLLAGCSNPSMTSTGAMSGSALTVEQWFTLPDLGGKQVALKDVASNHKAVLINFWATWCLPCVKELPYFIQLDSVYKKEAFKLVLVSLDFKKDYLRKLQPFVRERGLQGHVIVLEDNRSDYWINDIDRSWGGSIPATLVYKGKKRAFFERTFHHVNELSDIVEPFLNQ